ncbi:winged helix-turn-helix domain-containing protein [Mucilaginibacter sp. SP1R1]|uniref:winged helix-turn-helix domain-containing protein n=1 Tax=Mucilaginibacter sp. SP1R1 TaxID=2723091 RepID=UPI00160E8FEF|nr:winged helix-turn-helix domain-containing protein [Mucilaginibacter sp. SP1R1]MBB6147801.1 molybdate transport system regulatory protein [Mucilaginibacter sp. SP1R1]
MSNPIFKLNGRVWIETGDEKVLGHGRVELLERIQASGSIRQAALQMKMSYKQAWDLVNHMNDGFGTPVVISQRGGKGGGKAIVTEHGLEVIKQFHLLHQKLQEFLKDNTELLKL